MKNIGRVSRLASRVLPHALALAFLAGCNTYDIVQSNQFMDEDGERITVDYGRAERDHVNTFRSPANGREMEFRSKLVIDVEMPDGESFTAWQTMNMTGSGTLYKTDDDEWTVLARGFTCLVVKRDETAKDGYRTVFKGVLCNTPRGKVEKDTRWRKIDTPAPRVKQQ